MNTQKYVQAIVDATGINGETLGAVRMGIHLAVNDQLFAQSVLHGDVEYYQGVVQQQAAIVGRLQGLEDQLLAWLDAHSQALPIVLAADYDQHLAAVIVEVLNQQQVTILTQAEALEAQREAMGRMRQQPPAPQIININTAPDVDLTTLAKNVVRRINGGGSVSAASTDNPNGSAITVAAPTIPADWTHGDALYVELHRLAREGCGPSKPRYDDERAQGMPAANEVIATAGKRWFAILKDAGLKAPIRAAVATIETEGAPDGDATFRS